MTNRRRDRMELASIIVLGALAAAACVYLGGCNQLSMLPRPQRPIGMRVAEVPAATPACLALDRDVIGLTASSIGFGILSSGSGVTSLFTTSTPRYVVGGVSVGLSLFAGVFAYLSTAFASSFTQQCTTPGGQ